MSAREAGEFRPEVAGGECVGAGGEMEDAGERHSSGRFELPLALSQGCASLVLGYFRPVAPGRGGDLARLRGTGWRWRDQLNVPAIALSDEMGSELPAALE